jgi:hypothetical protein
MTKEANTGADPSAHPVYTIKAGMPKTVVVDLLGPPTSAQTSQDVFGSYKTVIGNPPMNREWWLYRNTPPGHDTHIAINEGVIDVVKIDAAPRRGRAGRLSHLVSRVLRRAGNPGNGGGR